MKMIEVNKLNYSIKDEEILKNISFNINKGEYVSLIGSNGSGKSTLALVIAGIVDEMPEGIKSKEKIGIVLENPDNQIIGTTVEDDILFGLQNIDITKEEMFKRLDETLERFDLRDLQKRQVITLSGGEKQKLAFASLWALRYEVYILDEVTSMLDPESKDMILDLIDNLVKEGKTVIHITHFINESSLTDRTIILNKGTIVADDETSIIMKNRKLLEENRLI